jgi:hypothetical protein
MLTLTYLIDDAKCYETVRQRRWADRVRCPKCDNCQVLKRGKALLGALLETLLS